MKRGDIYYADLSPVVGSEQGGVRPVLIVQNDIGNRYSPTVIAAAITSQTDKNKLPTHIELDCKRCGLSRDSIVLAGCRCNVAGQQSPVHQLWAGKKPLTSGFRMSVLPDFKKD